MFVYRVISFAKTFDTKANIANTHNAAFFMAHHLVHFILVKYSPRLKEVVPSGLKLVLNSAQYGTHSMRKTKATLTDENKEHKSSTILLGHVKRDSTIRYLVIEIEKRLKSVTEF